VPAGSCCYTVVKTPEKVISNKAAKNAGQMAGVLIPVHKKS